MRRRKAHPGHEEKKVRSERRNSACTTECGSPSTAQKRKRQVQTPARPAKSRTTRQAPGSKTDWAPKEKPESQGQAATPGRETRRSTPCRNGNRRGRRGRRQPPMPGRGRVSKPATGCKQWPGSFSRFEYQPFTQKKLNRFWLLLVNFWRVSQVTVRTGVPVVRWLIRQTVFNYIVRFLLFVRWG